MTSPTNSGEQTFTVSEFELFIQMARALGLNYSQVELNALMLFVAEIRNRSLIDPVTMQFTDATVRDLPANFKIEKLGWFQLWLSEAFEDTIARQSYQARLDGPEGEEKENLESFVTRNSQELLRAKPVDFPNLDNAAFTLVCSGIYMLSGSRDEVLLWKQVREGMLDTAIAERHHIEVNKLPELVQSVEKFTHSGDVRNV